MNYVTMPQNDRRQIEQILREYESEPAKGLAHGVQKDAIQNGFGARKTKSEANACKGEWKFFFELLLVNGKYALTFWDEGTTGLTGDIVDAQEIEARSARGELGPDYANQKLSRFLTRFESGGNAGAGSFGRGKLIFQAASDTQEILIDSLRDDDSKYIALDRKVIGTQLKQPMRPYVGEDAINFIHKQTAGALTPLKNSGTRITILSVNKEVVDAFKNSFKAHEGGLIENDFSLMIQETWWEIIQMGAEIYLRDGAKEKVVVLSAPLKPVIEAKNEERGYRVFHQKVIPISINNNTYQIKELKLIVAPEVLDEDLRQVWIQRKRMKIGPIDARISKHPKIQKKLSGYVRLDANLEELFELAEGTTHYSFHSGRAGVKQVKEVIAAKIEEFQRLLGFHSESGDGKIHNELNNALKDLNESASQLGLPTEFSTGKPKKEVALNIIDLQLPNKGTTRIELGDKIGPITFSVKNNSAYAVKGDLIVTCEQGRNVNGAFNQTAITLEPGLDREIQTPLIDISKDKYTPGAMLLVRGRLKRTGINSDYDQVSRSLWIAMDPPAISEYPVNLDIVAPGFPRKETRRVELGEIISKIGFNLSNTSNENLFLNIDVKVRKAKTVLHEVKDLFSLCHEKDFVLPAMADKTFELGDLNVSSEIFGPVWAEQANEDERQCELFFNVRFSKECEALKKVKGDLAAPRKSIPFYCGVDPAGQSIFKHADPFDDKNDRRRAYVTGERVGGYTIRINTGHPAYKFVESQEAEVREAYFQEQMIFHASVLAIKNDLFVGPLAEFKEDLSSPDIPPSEVALKMDEMIGGMLMKLRR